jgi:hypothetical protein
MFSNSYSARAIIYANLSYSHDELKRAVQYDL